MICASAGACAIDAVGAGYEALYVLTTPKTDGTSAYQYLPDDLESLEVSSPQRSSTQKRNRTSAASLSSSSLSSASGGSGASAVSAARKPPPPPRSLSPPPPPVVQGLLAVDAKVKVTASSKDELEVRVLVAEVHVFGDARAAQ